MKELRQGMRSLADEIDLVAFDFRRALMDKSAAPKQVLLELQQGLDHLRQALWDTRKLCDPFLVTPRGQAPVSAGSLTERVVRYIDEQRANTQPPLRRRG